MEDRQIPAEAHQRGAQVGQANTGLLCSDGARTCAGPGKPGRQPQESAEFSVLRHRDKVRMELFLWEGNQRRETEANTEDCVNSCSPLRRVWKRGPAGGLDVQSDRQMPVSWKRHLWKKAFFFF